jgi:hypothetical protein
MKTEQKIVRAKVGLLELAKQLGNVSQACKMMGYDPRFVVAKGISLRRGLTGCLTMEHVSIALATTTVLLNQDF